MTAFDQDTAISEFCLALGQMAQIIYRGNKERGFWSAKRGVGDDDFNFGEKIALMHSELSEALEGHRADAMDSHLPHRRSEEVELADCLIRILDLAGAAGMDIGAAVQEKLAFNATRPFKHGKRY